MAPRRKPIPVRETVMYPKTRVSPGTSPCRNKSLPCEHLLDCGHLVTTAKPNEPCARNCYHNATWKKQKNAEKRLQQQPEFYCDACIETTFESMITASVSSEGAEAIRAELRQREATRRDKESEFRKCYIAQKITSVPCDEEGNILDGYSPLDNSHPFDTATPRTGPNMFDGIEVERPQTKDPKRKKTSKKVAPMMVSSRKGEPEDGSSSASEAASENLEDPLAEGARWLNEQKELARRRQEEGTSPIRRRRATARPTVLSSSPETDMSSFVVHSSSPLVTQMSPHDQVHSPRSSKKRKREPDNTTRTTEHRQFVRLTRANQKAPNSLRANKNTKIGATVVPSAQKGHHKAAGKLTAPQPVAKAPKGLLSKRVYSAL